MPNTLSGWPAVKNGKPAALKTFQIPGTISPSAPTGRRVTLRKDVGGYLVAFTADFNKKVMKLNKNTGGYNYREARSGDGISDHAAGTAIDINWDVLRQGDRECLTQKQIDALLALIKEYEGIGWGGFWGGGLKGRSNMFDPMHFYLGETNPQYYLNHMKRMNINANGVRKS